MAQGGAKTIHQLRQEQGWTPEQVARQVRVAEITVERWERGDQRPQLRYRRRLAELFGVSAASVAPHGSVIMRPPPGEVARLPAATVAPPS